MARREREKKFSLKKRTLRAIFFLVKTGRKETPDSAKKGKALSSCQLSLVGIQVGSCCTKTTTDLCLARGTVRKANRPTKSDAGGAGGSGGGGVGTYP